jgi:hypothetical protein
MSQRVFKLATSAAAFDGIYIGFTVKVGSETRVIVAYTADRVVTVSADFGSTLEAGTSAYAVRASTGWAGYPTQMTDCPGAVDVAVASVANIAENAFLLIDDEIFKVVSLSGTTLSCLRARSGSVAASHASGAAVNIISGTGVANYGASGADSLLAALQASTTLYTGGVVRRCATITLDQFRADATDNIYRNWYIAITSGAGVAQSARILHYDGDLKLAVIDCVAHGQFWTGYAQAGYASGYSGQGYGAFSSSGNVPTPCRRSWITPPAYSYRCSGPRPAPRIVPAARAGRAAPCG